MKKNGQEVPETLAGLQSELDLILKTEEHKRKKLQEANLRYENEIAPVLDLLREYLRELISLLNNERLQQSERTRYLCMPEVEYDLSQIGMGAFGVIQGQQRNYEIITSTEINRLSDFSLSYQCVPERIIGVQHIELRRADDFNRRVYLQNLLKKYQLQYHCTERTCQDSSVKMIFTLQPEVRVKLDFIGNPEGDSFQVVITNAGGMIRQGQLGILRFPRVIPEQVGIEVVEALIRFIVRQPHKLFWYWEVEEQAIPMKEPEPSSKTIPRKQTYTFDVLSIKNILQKLQKQNDTLRKKIEHTHTEQSKKMDEVKESFAERSKQAQKEHDQFMAELEKIRVSFEKGQAENRSFFSWIVSVLSLGRKHKEW